MLDRSLVAFLFSIVVVSTLSTSTFLKAEERSIFKRKPIEGEVISKDRNHIELKSIRIVKETTTKITLVPDTRYEQEERIVSESNLKKGQTVQIIGTKLPSGELIARKVILGSQK